MMKNWITTVTCWDGVLPLIAFLCPLLVKANFPKGHIAEVVATVLVPAFLALVRAAVAQRTLRTYFAERLPQLRQIWLALVIITLLLVEIATGLKVFAPEAPILAFILLGWFTYFGLIAAATIPPRSERIEKVPLGEQFP